MRSATPVVIALGEALIEFMRPRTNLPLDQVGPFEGPFPSGAPAIFADACARLDLEVGFIGTVGDDAFGRLFRRRLSGDGVDLTHLVVDPERTTGTAFVSYQNDGSRDFLFHVRHAAAGQVPVIDPAYFNAIRHLHITGSTLAIGPEWQAACLRAASLARTAGAHVSFDPNIRPELLGHESIGTISAPILDLATVVLPSGDELRTLTGIDTPEQAARSLFARGVELVVRKQGLSGSTLYMPSNSWHMPTRSRVALDPTGAGDAFAAAIAYGLLHGSSPEAMLRLANAVGGMAVTCIGPMEGTPPLADALREAALAG